MKKLDYSKPWDKSYSNNDNLLLYPHEEVIRFTNKYINKRIDTHSFEISFSEFLFYTLHEY